MSKELTRSEKAKKIRGLNKKWISIKRYDGSILEELEKGDAEMRLLYKFLKERVQRHNSKLQSQITRLQNKGTID